MPVCRCPFSLGKLARLLLAPGRLETRVQVRIGRGWVRISASLARLRAGHAGLEGCGGGWDVTQACASNNDQHLLAVEFDQGVLFQCGEDGGKVGLKKRIEIARANVARANEQQFPWLAAQQM